MVEHIELDLDANAIVDVPAATSLTIAGSDPSGGAGLQADLKTFQQLGVYGMSAVTLLTAQNTRGVTGIELCSPKFVEKQLQAILGDISPDSVKTGALGSVEIADVVAAELSRVRVPIVVDPVLVSKHGDLLAGEDMIAGCRDKIFPLATLITPNRFETEKLTGVAINNDVDAERAVDLLLQTGASAILIKAGELDGRSIHYVFVDGILTRVSTPRLESGNTHGSGCVLSAVITGRLALGSCSLFEAIQFGLTQTFRAIKTNTIVGGGIQPAETRVIVRDAD